MRRLDYKRGQRGAIFSAISALLIAVVVIGMATAEPASAAGSDSKPARLSAALSTLIKSSPIKTSVEVTETEIIWKEEIFNCFQDSFRAALSDLDFAASTKVPNADSPGNTSVSVPCRQGNCVHVEYGSSVWPIEACPLDPNKNKTDARPAFVPASTPDKLTDKILATLKQYGATAIADGTSASAECGEIEGKATALEKQKKSLEAEVKALGDVDEYSGTDPKKEAAYCTHELKLVKLLERQSEVESNLRDVRSSAVGKCDPKLKAINERISTLQAVTDDLSRSQLLTERQTLEQHNCLKKPLCETNKLLGGFDVRITASIARIARKEGKYDKAFLPTGPLFNINISSNIGSDAVTEKRWVLMNPPTASSSTKFSVRLDTNAAQGERKSVEATNDSGIYTLDIAPVIGNGAAEGTLHIFADDRDVAQLALPLTIQLLDYVHGEKARLVALYDAGSCHDEFMPSVRFHKLIKPIQADLDKQKDALTDKHAGSKEAQELEKRGSELAAKDEYEKAILEFSQAIAADPMYTAAYRSRCLANMNAKHFQDAIADCSKTIEFDPKRPYAYYVRGRAHAALGDDDGALVDYNSAIEIAPKAADFYQSRGNLSARKGNYDQAIVDFSKAIELEPREALGYLNRGENYLAKGEDEKGNADLKVVLQLKGNDADTLTRIGVLRFAHAQFQDAAGMFLKAIDQKDDAHAMLWRYLARTRAGEPATEELEANLGRLKSHGWPFAVAEFYLGKRSSQATTDAASEPDEKCEAQFYVGEWQLIKGNASEALKLLSAEEQTCPKTSDEHLAAAAELKKLAESSGAPAPKSH